MKLIIGGNCQGKTAFAEKMLHMQRTEFLDGRCCSQEELCDAGCVMHFHEYIKKELLAEQDVSGLAELLAKENPTIAIISDEVGYGVVPVDAFERRYREAIGRICTKIAASSDEVYRVVCGIGMQIKGGVK